MKSILDIYSRLLADHNNDERFIGETFIDCVYDTCHPQLTIVDLGAFTGEFGFSCLPFAKVIYAVEPDPVPFDKLEKYVEEFGLKDKVKIFNFAIAAEDGEKIMDLTHAGGSHFADEGKSVKTYSLTTFMKDNNIEHIDILKVDIEGGENEIFASPEFAKLVSKIDLIIGEHSGFPQLEKLGFEVKSVGNGVYLATK